MADLSLIIKLAGQGFANREELQLRGRIEDLIDERQMGECLGGGSGGGYMDVSIESSEPICTREALHDLMTELGVKDYKVDLYSE